MATWHDNAFFGLHFDIHATLADKNLGRDASVKQLIEQFEKIKPDFVQCDCKGHPGVTAWPTDVGVRSPGIVKDALAIWREATRRLDLPLIMHYSGVYDVAAVANHPDWGRIKSARETAAAGGNALDHDHTCPLSDYTAHYMIPQMLELIRKYDIDGFWVDGENWATQPCYCPRCRAEFTRRTGIEHAPEGDDEPHWNEWLAFTRDLFVEHVDKYAHAIHAEKPSCSVCSNWMYSVRQPDPITAAVDYISGDFSYIWSGRTALIESRFMSNRGLKWDLMAWGFSSYGPMDSWEFKSVPALCQEAAIVMSAGGAFTIYDTPNRTGNIVAWHMDELADVAAFCRARQKWCQDSQSVRQALVLHAPEHYYPMASEGFYNTAHGSTDAIEGAVHALMDNHISVDIMNTPDALSHASEFPMIVVPEQLNLSDETVAALIKYAQDGGTLIVSGVNTAPRFADALGVSVCEQPDAAVASAEAVNGGAAYLSLHRAGNECAYVQIGGRTATLIGPWCAVKAENAASIVMRQYTRDIDEYAQVSDYPFATVRVLGKGRIVGIYSDFFTAYSQSHYPTHRMLMGKVLDSARDDRLMRVDAPSSVYVSLRQKDGALLVNLVNMGSSTPLSPQRSFVEDVPPAGPVHVELHLAHRPRSVRLAPDMRPVDWSYSDGRLNVNIAQIGIHDILEIVED